MTRLDDREVNIILLLKYIFDHWKQICLVMVLCAVIGAGLGFVKHKLSVKKEDQKMSSEELSTLYDSLSVDEQDRLDYMLSLNQKLIEMKDYMENNPIMKTKAYEVPMDFVEYSVTPDEDTYKTDLEKLTITNRLISAYRGFCLDGRLVEEIKKTDSVKKINEAYLYDLIDVGYDSNVIGNDIFTVTLKEVDDFINGEQVKQLIRDYEKEVEKTVGKHKLNIVYTSRKTVKSDYFADYQEKVRARYDATRNSIRLMKLNGELSDAVVKCYENMIGEDGYHFTFTEASAGRSGSLKTMLKMMILLMAAGAFLACTGLCIYYLLFVFGRYLVSTEDFACFNLKYIGDLKNKSQFNKAVSKIYAHCSKHDITEIALVSSDASMIDRKDLDALTDALAKKGINAVMVDDYGNMTDIDKLLSVGRCLFVEKVNSSQVKRLQELVDYVSDSEIDVLGVVNEG